jgi:putative ATP-dependent endonuclease of OLD family
MYIQTLSIRNYRNFDNAKFSFKRGINTIIGENGSGKTNVFRAMRYLIDSSMPRQLYFSENDFNRTLENNLGHWIIISVDVAEVDKSEECQILVNQIVAKEDDILSKIVFDISDKKNG